MARVKLTDQTIRALKTEKTQEDYFDSGFNSGCLGLRVSKSGKKVFFVRYKVGKKQKKRIERKSKQIGQEWKIRTLIGKNEKNGNKREKRTTC